MGASNMFGVDVSKWQGAIDWKTAKANGVKFAMIKCGQGKPTNGTNKYKEMPFTDSMFVQNVTNAYAAGIYVGTYWYFTATTEAETLQEVNYYINAMKPYKSKIKFPCAIDIEEDGLHGNTNYKTRNTKLVKLFCDKLKVAGYTPAIYTNDNYLTYYLNYNELKSYDLWYARWTTTKPTKYSDMAMWQNSSRGKIKGINGDVDTNYCYKDYVKPNYIDIVQSRVSPRLEQQTIDYINKYKHSQELWKRLAEMK